VGVTLTVPVGAGAVFALLDQFADCDSQILEDMNGKWYRKRYDGRRCVLFKMVDCGTLFGGIYNPVFADVGI